MPAFFVLYTHDLSVNEPFHMSMDWRVPSDISFYLRSRKGNHFNTF